jgi:DNA-binding CsgD family transcriptional regulator
MPNESRAGTSGAEAPNRCWRTATGFPPPNRKGFTPCLRDGRRCRCPFCASGEAVCPPRLCRTLFQHIASSGNGHAILRTKARTGLTRPEQQLVPLIGRGLTNKEIAAQLNLSEQTVKNRIHRICSEWAPPTGSRPSRLRAIASCCRRPSGTSILARNPLIQSVILRRNFSRDWPVYACGAG